MHIHKTTVFKLFLLQLLMTGTLTAQTVRILPMGNSITFDDRTGDTRPDGDKISYRYRLYQLISAAGYTFDFTGSENAGINFFHSDDLDDNAGFPGITDDQLAYLINTGYNLKAGKYEAPGAYLNYYPSDIILLHIGTNELDENPADVEDILNNIRHWDSDVIVLVARIINRATYSLETTTFNNNVAAMVAARGDSRIIMVNMETGAGINYSTDMFDDLHPNQNGYNKMAAKWFEAIDALNTPPVISTVPAQSTIQGTPFGNVILDDYVTDTEDADNKIHWTYRLQANSKFSANIDANRILKVTATDNNWFGSETVFLKATDSGNGAFPKSDSVQVVFTVLKKNSAPVITSAPVLSVNEDNNYSYTIVATDVDGDVLIYSAPVKPAWLSFSPATRILSGRPTNSEVGIHNVTLRVTDGDETVQQVFQITVANVNDVPVITSTPSTTVKVGDSYVYEITATDIDAGDVLTYSASIIPAWLSFTSGTNKGTLFGIPAQSNLGANGIILKVSDGHSDVIQGFTLMVSLQTGLGDVQMGEKIIVYPNPARDQVFLKTEKSAQIKFWLFDAAGTLVAEMHRENANEIEIDLAGISKGIYPYKIMINNDLVTGKLTIIN